MADDIPRRLSDSDGDIAGIDNSTQSLQTVSYQHHEIHAGSNFYVSDVAEPGNGEVLDIQITTPDSAKEAHFRYSIGVKAETALFLYEGATIVTPGAAITPLNSLRRAQLSNPSILTLKQAVHASLVAANAANNVTGATVIDHGIIGSGRDDGNIARDDEIILKANTVYVLRLIQGGSTSGYVDFHLKWYEHTDKSL